MLYLWKAKTLSGRLPLLLYHFHCVLIRVKGLILPGVTNYMRCPPLSASVALQDPSHDHRFDERGVYDAVNNACSAALHEVLFVYSCGQQVIHWMI
jgi:hypothetical protein